MKTTSHITLPSTHRVHIHTPSISYRPLRTATARLARPPLPCSRAARDSVGWTSRPTPRPPSPCRQRTWPGPGPEARGAAWRFGAAHRQERQWLGVVSLASLIAPAVYPSRRPSSSRNALAPPPPPRPGADDHNGDADADADADGERHSTQRIQRETLASHTWSFQSYSDSLSFENTPAFFFLFSFLVSFFPVAATAAPRVSPPLGNPE